MSSLRVALFTDSWNEPNGVATLSRELASYAREQSLPFLCFHGSRETTVADEGSLREVALRRSAASFALDTGLYWDPFLLRYYRRAREELRAFCPDLIQITGPGDFGILGAILAHQFELPLVASWHTNLHEYAARRLDQTVARTPALLRRPFTSFIERQCLRGILRFYRTAQFTLAPNARAMDLLAQSTGKPVFRVEHGVDLDLFRPVPKPADSVFRIGYVGRLTPEKNVRVFAELERRLFAAGHSQFEILMVGEGSELPWLTRNLRNGIAPGILLGEHLARAFASMDVFVFPSRTDTFGLAVLEALANGVPVVVTPETGTHIGMRHGSEGLICEDVVDGVLELTTNETLRAAMAKRARTFALAHSWTRVFERWYHSYEAGLHTTSSQPCSYGRYEHRAESVRAGMPVDGSGSAVAYKEHTVRSALLLPNNSAR